MICVTKIDSRLRIDRTLQAVILERYKTACLAKINGIGFISILTDTRSGLPDSLNISVSGNINDVLIKNELKLSQLDFSNTYTWDSKLNISNYCALPEYTLTAIKNNISGEKSFVVNIIDNLVRARNFRGLIGLGPGLTPAGDDFLVGALNTTAVFSKTVFSNLKSAISGLLDNTGKVSRHYLKAALDLRSGEDMQELFKAIISGDFQNIVYNTKKILSYGSDSGYFILKGLLWGLQQTQ